MHWLHKLCTSHTPIQLNSSTSIPSFILTPILLWQLWLNRNNNHFKYQNHLIDTTTIISPASQVHYLTSIPNKKTKAKREITPWAKLQSPLIKLNIDGAYDPTNHYGGAGGVFCDSTGQWIYDFETHLPSTNAIQAELLALYHGLTIASNRRLCPLIVETDSQVLLQMGNPRYLQLITACRSMIQELNIQQLSHTVREGNEVVDAVAKFGKTNIRSPPQSILYFEDPLLSCN